MNQADRMLEHLQAGKTINRLDCWNELGILEGPARICELRARGHDIKTKMVPVINRYGDPVRVANWSMICEGVKA
ncbi:helix-turn-helix domain-containing protein [bacterium]|nr:helix-turn-helix domain-containing protein [bacterium]